MSERKRDAARVRVFPPGVPLLTVLAGVALERLWPLTMPIPAPHRWWAGWFIILAANLGLGLWSVIIFHRSGEDENPWKPTHSIVDRGPFRVSRNPMYLQMVLICIGFAIVFANGWILLLTPLCAAVLQRFAILPEERYLEQKFGEPYRAYMRRVRRWI